MPLTLPLYMTITYKGKDYYLFVDSIDQYERAIELDENYLGDFSEVEEFKKSNS